MTVYLVALMETDESVWTRIKTEWPDRHYMLDDRLALISIAPNGVSAPSAVAERIGIQEVDQGIRGLVIRLRPDAISGILPTSAVDWLRAADAS